tara:strand:- start:1837 stop:2898 length:1062 start_codon:yes stop_codon:yes gene_type:complete
MNTLRDAIGLLNAQAPEGEFLAYINKKEAKMLKDAGGSGLLTPQGIPSFVEYGGRDAFEGAKAGNEFGGNRGDNGGNGNNYQERIQRIAKGQEPGFRPQDEQPFGLSKEEAFRQGRITKDQLEAPAVLESQVVDDRSPFQVGFDNVIDFYKQGGILGAVARGLSPMSEALQQKAMTFSLNKRLSNIYEDNPDFEDYESLDEIPGEIGAKVRDLETDLQGVRDGTFKQSDFTAKYGSGDTTNPLDASFDPNSLTRDEQQNLQNLFTPELTYAVSGQTPQSSVAQQFFNNIGNNLGVSSAYLDTYNAAKDKISQSLNLQPITSQFGFGNTFNQNFDRSMTSANPFFEELTNQGLI